MEAKKQSIRYGLLLLGLLVLVIGLSSAVRIYLISDGNREGALYYEQSGGSVYPVQPGDSRKYVHDLEMYGGKANVLADSLRRWLAGLWNGKTLALALALFTLAVSGWFIRAAFCPTLPSGRRGRDKESTAGPP